MIELHGRPSYAPEYRRQVAMAACEPRYLGCDTTQVHGLNPNMFSSGAGNCEQACLTGPNARRLYCCRRHCMTHRQTGLWSRQRLPNHGASARRHHQACARRNHRATSGGDLVGETLAVWRSSKRMAELMNQLQLALGDLPAYATDANVT